ncbi:MAG: PilZ domain-containing protein, partial [Pseudomonadota bacterium]
MSVLRPRFVSPSGSARVQALKARTIGMEYEPAPSAAPVEPSVPIGRRGAARLRLSIPAKLVSLYDTHRCILIDLSSTGAQIGLQKPMEIEQKAFLQIAGLELFCEVVRTAHGANGGVNGLSFDPPLEDEDVLDVRRFAESHEADEVRALRSEVRAWVD